MKIRMGREHMHAKNSHGWETDRKNQYIDYLSNLLSILPPAGDTLPKKIDANFSLPYSARTS